MAHETLLIQDVYKRQRQLQAAPGETLYSCLTRGGIELDAPCGGHCFCGKCKVQVEPCLLYTSTLAR